MQDAKTSRAPFPVFYDAETVPQWETFEEVPERTAATFEKRFRREIDETAQIKDVMGGAVENEYEIVWQRRAGMCAEYGKVICVSLGLVLDNGTKLKVKTIAPQMIPLVEKNGGCERVLLDDVLVVLSKTRSVAGHNIKSFDNLFLCRRYAIHGMEPPVCLNRTGMKTWDDPNEDTMELWGFGEWRPMISLDALADALKIASPKGELDGSKVAALYYSSPPEGMLPWDHKAEVLKKIGDYCNGDIITTVNVYLKLKRLPIITPDRIEYAAATPQQQPKLEL